MAIKYIIVLFVETPRKLLLLAHIISTDEDPGLRIESFAVINLRGVSTNKTIINTYKGWTIRKVVGRVGKKQKKIHANKKDLKKNTCIRLV